MKVIVADIDGTVMDVSGRIRAVLDEIGVDGVDNPSRAADSLTGRLRSRFYDLFLSEKYTHLDTPVPEIIESVRALQAETGLPLVMLSGRPVTMKQSTQAALDATGLPIEAVLLRPMSQQMQRTAVFKVQALRKRDYEPVYIYDDDREILTALGAAFPTATLLRVTGPQTTPWPD